MKNAIICFVIFISLAGIAGAADNIAELLPKAEKGDVAAQVALGDLYQKQPEPDYVNSALWFTKAADAGDPYAQVELGILYWNGLGVEADNDKAFSLMKKAADQDFARGYGGMGLACQMGWGVQQDYGEAARWYRKAAEKGNVLAQVRLANLYKYGNGVPEDGKAAESWLLKATGQDSDPFLGYAYYEMGMLYANGARGIEKNEEEAIGWLQIAIDHGYKMAYVRLSGLLSDNKGTEDHEMAFHLNREMAEKGFAPAMNDLAFLYEQGVGTKKDEEKALYWYKKAADAGFAHSQFNLGVSYEKGTGVPVDLKAAYEWYNMAAAQGHKDAIKKRDKLRKQWEFALKGVYFTPNPVSPGEKGTIIIEYKQPTSPEPVEITANLSLWFGEKQIIPPFERRFPLSRDSTEQAVPLPLPIPEGAEKGVYRITVQASTITDEQQGQTFFEID